MNDGSIKIIIGAAQDRSVETVFASIEKRAQKAGQNISKSFANGGTSSGGGNGMGKAFDQAAASASKAERDIEKEIANQVKATKAAAREMSREHEKSAREHVRAEEQASRDIIKQFKDQTRERKRELAEQERAEKKATQPSRFARHMGMYAVNNLMPGGLNALGMASRVGGDLLRGAGVDMSISGTVARSIQMQSGSTFLANQERIATGSTSGGKHWNDLSRGIGNKLSVDSNNVQEMIMSMTAKTGEFQNAGSMGEQLASLGTASGANLRDMGNAAGYVYNQMKLLPDAGKRTIEVMRGIVGQTAVGAVDMPDYAVQLGRIAANASKFKGDVGDNIREQSALAQLAVEAGGASSPADAARSVAAFSNTFGKSARIKAFAAHGVELFTVSNAEHEKNGTPQDTLRKASDIIKDSFRKTKGDIPALSIMFADTLGRKPVQALATAYKGAGGGEKGIEAIRAQIDKYMNASLSKEVEEQNIKDYQESTAAKAVKFQNELDKIASISADSVFPALEKLAPQALAVADGFGKVAAWAAENPLQGFGAMIGASIANAGVQAAVRSSFEGLISAGFGPLGLAVVGLAATIEAVREDLQTKDERQKMLSVANGEQGVLEGEARIALRHGKFSEKNQNDLTSIDANLESRIKRATSIKHEDEIAGGAPTGFDAMMEGIVAPERNEARMDVSHLSELKRELEENKTILEMIKNGVLLVKITNPADIATAVGPKVFANGRQLDAGNLPAYLHR